jgi:uncharacterized membrane protein YqaE (UPF0057 family)
MKYIQIDFGTHKSYYHLNTYDDLAKEIKKTYHISPSHYYITTNSRLVSTDWDFNQNHEIHYKLNFKIKGGIPGIAKFFKSLVNSFLKIGELVTLLLKMPDILLWFFVDFLKWLLLDFFNPFFILEDLAKSIMIALRIIILAVLDALSGVLKFVVNLIFEPIVSGFWGYTPNKNEFDENDKSQSAKCAAGKRCFKQPQSKVAFPVIISTIILPPMGLFMELGLKGWMNLLICSILTLFYYFPGLIYALIILYC